MKRRKQSAASAVIEASLQLAQEHAQIIEANSHNHSNSNSNSLKVDDKAPKQKERLA